MTNSHKSKPQNKKRLRIQNHSQLKLTNPIFYFTSRVWHLTKGRLILSALASSHIWNLLFDVICRRFIYLVLQTTFYFDVICSCFIWLGGEHSLPLPTPANVLVVHANNSLHDSSATLGRVCWLLVLSSTTT